MNSIATISVNLQNGIAQLKKAGNDSPTREVGVILCHVLNCDESLLYAHDDYLLTNAEQDLFDNCMGKMSAGVPLPYITGHQEFMSLDFIVGSEVLIPRPETEILCEHVLSYLKKEFINKENIRLLDLCTGSGCIAVSIAHHDKRIFACGADISGDALLLAQKNAQKAGVAERTDFIAFDVMENESAKLDGMDRFDIITANPPYVSEKEMSELDKSVIDNEPKIALYGGVDGLDFYRTISKKAPTMLKEDGLIVFETGWKQANDVAEILSDNFNEIKIRKDLSGIERVVSGRLIIHSKARKPLPSANS